MQTTNETRIAGLMVSLGILVAGCAQKASAPPMVATPANANQQPVEVLPAEQVASAAESASAADEEEATKDSATAEESPAFYTVGRYDEKQDPAEDLARTIERASAENKRILIQVGGEWCGWCHRMSEYMAANEKVRKLLDEHFVVMMVTYPAENVESFLESYPDVPAYPHLFVLGPDGTFLHSQGTAELEHEKSYNEEVFCKFLNDWVL